MNVTSELDYGTSLCVACRLGNLDIVNILLKHRADPNVYTIYPPLHYALGGNKIDISKVLLEHGAEAKELNPLIIVKYNKSAVEVLLPHLSDVSKSDILHNIATDNIAETDHDIEIAELLLNAAVKLSYHIQCAEEQGKSKLVKLFNKYKKTRLITIRTLQKKDG